MPGKLLKVIKEFKDRSGRTWKPGENFTGDEQAVQQAKQAGNVQESSADQSGQSGQPSE